MYVCSVCVCLVCVCVHAHAWWYNANLLSLDGACVYVQGREANPLVKNCVIAEASNVGVFIDNHARVSVSHDLT